MDQLGRTMRSGSGWQSLAETGATLRVLATGTLLYLLAGSVFLICVGTNPIVVLRGIGGAFMTFVLMASTLMPWWVSLIIIAPIALFGAVRRRLWRQRAPVLVAIILCSLFTFMFGLVKNRLSLVVPFWADDLLTQIDFAVHFGHAPRDLLLWLEPVRTGRLLGLYFNTWVFLATFFPVLLIAFDPDRERRRVFTLMWMLCWVGLGNVLAIAGMSYGPLFADLFPGGMADAHRGVLDMLQREDARSLLATKLFLWHAYTGESQTLGSGISAFPSVHVGMATVIGLYIARLGGDLAQRLAPKPRLAVALRWGARLFSVIYVAFYLTLSVYLGWHYAVDGYASILLIGALYARLAARASSPVRRPWLMPLADRA